jgi:hypothetical protein
MRAAYGGYLGAEMKQKAPEFTNATRSIKALPNKVKKKKNVKKKTAN